MNRVKFLAAFAGVLALTSALAVRLCSGAPETDTALLSQAFDSTARLVGVSNRGTPSVSLTAASQFGAAIARAPAGDVWNERIYDPEVRIDGNVAQVWAYYTFHRNTTFNHCGVDAFMLVKVGTTWKITQLADSRRTEGCTHQNP